MTLEPAQMSEGPAQTTEEPAKKRTLHVPRWLDTAFYLLGLALLVWVVSRYPLADLTRACLKLGPWVMLTPVVALTWISCNTSALYLLLDKQVPWLPLLKIRLIGDGYNALLPLAGLGGEPFKVRHLARYVSTDRLVTALIRDRVTENAVGFLYTAFGLAVGFRRFSFSPAMRVALIGYIAFATLAGIASALLVVTTLPGKLAGWISKFLGVTPGEAVTVPLPEFLKLLFWYVAARITGCLELTVLLLLLGLGFDPITILFGYSLFNAAGFIAFMIPQGLGVYEGTAVWLFEILGFPGPLGVAVALARRGRMLVVGLIGVLLHVISNALAGRREANQVSPPSTPST